MQISVVKRIAVTNTYLAAVCCSEPTDQFIGIFICQVDGTPKSLNKS